LGEPLLVAYGVPANVTFAEGELRPVHPTNLSAAKNIHGIGTYDGPCHGAGSSHHYMFKVTATDLDPKRWRQASRCWSCRPALQGHAKGVAGLVGLFTKGQ
jgi:phosphatidylethanolamine-binding protein (PEBP) family uncharacterized protein